MRILLIADCHHFSTKDVYLGYLESFKKIGVDFDAVPLFDLVDESKPSHLSMDAAWGLILAKLLNVENEFTHVVIITGLITPEWFLKSAKKYGIVVSIVATEDPHSSVQLYEVKPYINYWFSNEKTMEDEKSNIFYVPTATNSLYPTIDKDTLPDNFKNDIVFVGTIYPDRVKPLEEACRFCEDNNAKISIYGPLLNTPKNSIIRKYARDQIMSNNDTKMLYYGSKLALNIDRNVLWNCNEEEGNSNLVGDGRPYSMNPRAYEIAMCRAPQLFINPRPEAFDVFGDNVYYSQYDNVYEELEHIFSESEELEQTKINNCFDIVRSNHIYLYRAGKILNILERDK